MDIARWEYLPCEGQWFCSVCGMGNLNLQDCPEDEDPMAYGGSNYCPYCGQKIGEPITDKELWWKIK